MISSPYEKNPLEFFFKPRSVAVIGAKDDPDTVGATLMKNLLDSPFEGEVFPVNPKRKEVMGKQCYPSIKAVPGPIDLVLIVTPASTVPALIQQCVDAGARTAVILSAGFKEMGPPGLELEREILEIANKGCLRIIGPNCLGVMNTIHGLNATFATSMAHQGNIAFISQSGAMCTAVLDWSLRERIGFSLFVSIGSMIDVDWGDLIDYLAKDPHTNSILMYIEDIGDARAFLAAAREVALTKPVIVVKAGRTAQAAQAATSHTGALAGSDEVFEMAMKQMGILRVERISQLFNMANFLSKQPIPKGPRLAIITNAGGPGVIATDAAVIAGAEIAPLSEITLAELNAALPEAWSRSNPVDILGDATPERYARAIELVSRDNNSDGILVVLSPQDMTEPTMTAEKILPYANLPEKPIIASWMGGEAVAKGARMLEDAGIPTFDYPDTGSELFGAIWGRDLHLRNLYKTPLVNYEMDGEKIAQEIYPEVEKIFNQIASSGRTILTEYESKQVLSMYGIPVNETRLAITKEEAIAQAEEIGYPVVLKICSTVITHKSDIGGVKLNLKDAEAVGKAFEEIQTAVSIYARGSQFEGVAVQQMVKGGGYELILGASVDPQFGPVLLFGSGGTFVEIYKDCALALPPLNATMSKNLIFQTKISQVLKGARGQKAINFAKLEEALVRFSQFIVHHPCVKECDLNPILASQDGVVAIDARIILFEKSISKEELPICAMRPYPSQYISHYSLETGEAGVIRPIRSEDEPKLIQMHKGLSEKAVRYYYLEFLSLSDRIDHSRLVKFCYSDFDRRILLLAEAPDSKGSHRISGLMRLTRLRGTKRAKLAIVIVDAYQNTDLCKHLLEATVNVARAEGIQEIFTYVPKENKMVYELLEKNGFAYEPFHDHSELMIGRLCQGKVEMSSCPAK